MSRALAIALLLATAAEARAQPAPGSDEAEAASLETVEADARRARRQIAIALLTGGVVSVAAGAGLMVPDRDNQAWRWGGGTVLAFGAIDAALGVVAVLGQARQARAFSAEAAQRRTRADLLRGRRKRFQAYDAESIAYAINLGLDGAYLLGAGVAIVASQLGVSDHERWLAVGVAGAVESLFLIGIDAAGLLVDRRAAHRVLEGLAPTVAALPNGATLGLAGRF